MEFLILLGVVVVSFMWGWSTREKVARKQTDKLFQHLIEQEIEEQEQLVRIKIEKHDGVLYAYHVENSLFIAQAKDKRELEEKLCEKFPGKRFGCSEDNLKEVGFTS
jgi:hypothetical protein